MTLAAVILTGASQEAFAFARAGEELQSRLLVNPAALRAVISIDNWRAATIGPMAGLAVMALLDASFAV